MFVLLFGLMFVVDEIGEFEDVMEIVCKVINNYIKGELIGCKIYEMDDFDVLLWVVWVL